MFLFLKALLRKRRMIEKIISFVVFVTTLLMLWIRTHNITFLLIFGWIDVVLFLMIRFSYIIFRYILPYMNICASLSRDFNSYNQKVSPIGVKMMIG